MRRLIVLYPRAWRDRYGAEFADLLAARPVTMRDHLDVLRGAIDAWIHPQVRRTATQSGGDRHHLPAAAAPVAAILGGLLFVASGLAIANTHTIGPDGYRDHGLALAILIVAMFVTSVAALAMATSRATRAAAAIMVGGAILALLPWPILALGFFTWVGASIALGAAMLVRGRARGFVPIAIGIVLTTFNTENEMALAAVPVGVLWILFAVAAARPDVSIARTKLVAGDG